MHSAFFQKVHNVFLWAIVKVTPVKLTPQILCVICSWQLMLDRKQKICVERIHWETDNSSYDQKAFSKVKTVFIHFL